MADINVSDKIGITDETQANLSTVEVNITDSVGATDGVQVGIPIIRVSDSIGIADGVQVIRPGVLVEQFQAQVEYFRQNISASQLIVQVEYIDKEQIGVSQFIVQTEYWRLKNQIGQAQFIVQVEWSLEPPPTFPETGWSLVHRNRLSVYLNKTEDGTKVLERINAAVGTYLFCDYDGKYRYVLYSQLSGEASLSFTDRDIHSIEETTDASEIISKVKAKYQHRHVRDYWQTYVYERAESQYLQGGQTAITKEIELPHSELSDAQLLAQRTALWEGERIITYKATVSHRGWNLLPSDFIQITSTVMNINAVLEVLEAEPDFLGGTTTLLLSGQRGLVGDAGQPGFWWGTGGNDNSVFPSALGGGSTDPWDDTWTDDQKVWARQNVGYWLTNAGFADATDEDSWLPSTWI